MSEGLNRTLGELRKALRVRMGFVHQGPASENNRDLLNSFLQEAHTYVAKVGGLPLRRKRATITTSPGSSLYDWHNRQEDKPIEPAQVRSISVKRGNAYSPLVHGIAQPSGTQGTPSHYDTLMNQLEVWPIPDARYELIIEYSAPLGRFERDDDRPCVPDELILLYALAVAKAHYHHSDAQVPGQAFEKLLAHYKSGQHGQRRYFVQNTDSVFPVQVIKTARGYTLLES
ncbi:MAG: hypothetical protein ON057_001786 [Glomeribacter sp. 1016415]|nr:hypothetical protein [Glomeribacter sp. 1016415]